MSKPENTQHGENTKFGLNTPHKYPSKNEDKNNFLDLAINLYPTGSVWNMSEESFLRKLHSGFNISFLRLKKQADSIINKTYPDNQEFEEEDCLYWENKLGLMTNGNLSLNLRKDIILRKMTFPRNFKARQGILYLQEQLDVYGFDCKIYENKFFDSNGNLYQKTAMEIFGNSPSVIQHDEDIQHGGGTQHGSGNFDVIANNHLDENFPIGGDENLWATFFIAAKNSMYEKGNVPLSRKREFRELILKLKPAHLVAFLFINYN